MTRVKRIARIARGWRANVAVRPIGDVIAQRVFHLWDNGRMDPVRGVGTVGMPNRAWHQRREVGMFGSLSDTEAGLEALGRVARPLDGPEPMPLHANFPCH